MRMTTGNARERVVGPRFVESWARSGRKTARAKQGSAVPSSAYVLGADDAEQSSVGNKRVRKEAQKLCGASGASNSV